MNSTAQIFLFGSLGGELRDGHENQISLGLKAPTPLPEVLNLLCIPSDRVQLVMVNHKAVAHDHMIQPGDRVSLFPKEYAIFADWKNFRH